MFKIKEDLSALEIVDCTLREGEQQSGVRFSAEDKIYLLHQLEEFGVQIVEVGHPGISPEDEEICSRVIKAARSAKTLAHSRATVEEVQAAARVGADWVGIWGSVNPISLKTKWTNKSLDDICRLIYQAISEAKRLGLRVRLTLEDASRSDWIVLNQTARIAIEAGADRISLADTVGIWEPTSCHQLVSRAVTEWKHPVEVHCHNDFGLALANTLAAVDAGAQAVDVSILGIGERVGITDLLQLAVVLEESRGEQRFHLQKISSLADAVKNATGYNPDELRPVIGKNAFTHTSKYHRNAVIKNPVSYEPFPPKKVGRKRKIINNRPPLREPRLPVKLKISCPFKKESSELKYHRDGPGDRWVLIDHRVDKRASFYMMRRTIDKGMKPHSFGKHVDTHTHHCDSTLIFMGNEPDRSGLTCMVYLNGEEKVVHSPATIFIPAKAEHTYSYVSGTGDIYNIVLAPNYNESLYEKTEIPVIFP